MIRTCIGIFLAVAILIFPCPGTCLGAEADPPVMDEIVSVAEKTERYLNTTGSTVTVFGREDLDDLQAGSITEALESIASIHLTERGTPGSQADIAVNGSSSEGVLVLVNGIRVHDPQTGHFAMDIPVDISAVERIEVMHGGGSSVYGASASGGIINIVTANPSDGLGGLTSLGSHGTGNVRANMSRGSANGGFSLSLRSGRSDGYREASHLQYTGADLSGNAVRGGWNIKGHLGLLDKDFGAGNFYGPYPSAERTKTYQSGMHASRLIGDENMLRFRFGGRGHSDDFILVEDNPSLYRNTHYNRTYSAAAEFLAPHRAGGYVLIGTEAEMTGITSGSLGTHDDRNVAVFSEVTTRLGRAELSFTSRLDTGTRESAVFSPGIGLTLPVGGTKRLLFRAERSFRAPTYTDRFYNSPANIGDPDLRPEYVTSVTTGFEAGSRRTLGISLFTRRVEDMIDWVRDTGATAWNAANHGQVTTNGVSIHTRQPLVYGWFARFQAVHLDQSVSRRAGIESKYSLNPLEESVTAVFSGPAVFGTTASLIARYEKPLQDSPRRPVAVKLARSFNTFTTVLSVRNLFNESYEEIPDLPAPGRWITMTIEVNR